MSIGRCWPSAIPSSILSPPPPAPVYYLPPPPDDFVILEPPPPPIGLFILPQPIFVPIPVYVQGAALCGAAAEQHHLCQHPQQGRHQQRHQQAATAGVPVPVWRTWRQGGRTPRLPGCAGAGWRHADTAACGGAKGHADPAGQGAGAAERHDQSCREGWFARRRGRPEGRTRRCRPMRRARCLRPSLCRGPTPCRFRVPGARHPRLRALRYRQGAVNPNARPGAAARLRRSGAAPGARPAIGATAPARRWPAGRVPARRGS